VTAAVVQAGARLDQTVSLRISCLACAIQRQDEPHFIVIDDGGVHWIVEGTRDEDVTDPVVIAKRDAAAAWVATVNPSDEVQGTWAHLLASESVRAVGVSWKP
jgi:type III restriction enzyme